METEHIASVQTPLGASLHITRKTFRAFKGKPKNRVSFLAGLHGDELEGVYICHRLIEYLKQLKENEPEAFLGEIHLYPVANPEAVRTGSRLWPFFSSDLNRQLGKNSGPSLPARLSEALLKDLESHSDWAVDFHASNLHLKELPQIRIVEGFDRKLIPLANHSNTDLIWVHPASGVFESTFGYNLNQKKIPTLVVEAGICLRIDQTLCNQIFTGMVHLLHHTGILSTLKGAPEVKDPLLIHPSQVKQIQAQHAGLFVSRARLGETVQSGDILGTMIDPLEGHIIEEVTSPAQGLLFTLREHPLTYPGAPLARVALNERTGV